VAEEAAKDKENMRELAKTSLKPGLPPVQFHCRVFYRKPLITDML